MRKHDKKEERVWRRENGNGGRREEMQEEEEIGEVEKYVREGVEESEGEAKEGGGIGRMSK